MTRSTNATPQMLRPWVLGFVMALGLVIAEASPWPPTTADASTLTEPTTAPAPPTTAPTIHLVTINRGRLADLLPEEVVRLDQTRAANLIQRARRSAEANARNRPSTTGRTIARVAHRITLGRSRVVGTTRIVLAAIEPTEANRPIVEDSETNDRPTHGSLWCNRVRLGPWSLPIDRIDPPTTAVLYDLQGNVALQLVRPVGSSEPSGDAPGSTSDVIEWDWHVDPDELASPDLPIHLELPRSDIATTTIEAPSDLRFEIGDEDGLWDLGASTTLDSGQRVWRITRPSGPLVIQLRDRPTGSASGPLGYAVRATTRFALADRDPNATSGGRDRFVDHWRARLEFRPGIDPPDEVLIQLDATLIPLEANGEALQGFEPVAQTMGSLVALRLDWSGPEPATIELSGVIADVPEDSWTVPGLEPLSGAWSGGETILTRGDGRRIEPVTPLAGRPAPIVSADRPNVEGSIGPREVIPRTAPETSRTGAGSTIRFRVDGPGAVAEVRFGNRRASGRTRVRGRVILEPDRWRLEAEVSWEAGPSAMGERRLALTPGWIVGSPVASDPTRIVVQPEPTLRRGPGRTIIRVIPAPRTADATTWTWNLTAERAGPDPGTPWELPRLVPLDSGPVDELWSLTLPNHWQLRPQSISGLLWSNVEDLELTEEVEDSSTTRIAWRWVNPETSGTVLWRPIRQSPPNWSVTVATIRPGRLILDHQIALSGTEKAGSFVVHHPEAGPTPPIWNRHVEGRTSLLRAEPIAVEDPEVSARNDGSPDHYRLTWENRNARPSVFDGMDSNPAPSNATEAPIQILSNRTEIPWDGRGPIPVINLHDAWSPDHTLLIRYDPSLAVEVHDAPRSVPASTFWDRLAERSTPTLPPIEPEPSSEWIRHPRALLLAHDNDRDGSGNSSTAPIVETTVVTKAEIPGLITNADVDRSDPGRITLRLDLLLEQAATIRIGTDLDLEPLDARLRGRPVPVTRLESGTVAIQVPEVEAGSIRRRLVLTYRTPEDDVEPGRPPRFRYSLPVLRTQVTTESRPSAIRTPRSDVRPFEQRLGARSAIRIRDLKVWPEAIPFGQFLLRLDRPERVGPILLDQDAIARLGLSPTSLPTRRETERAGRLATLFVDGVTILTAHEDASYWTDAWAFSEGPTSLTQPGVTTRSDLMQVLIEGVDPTGRLVSVGRWLEGADRGGAIPDDLNPMGESPELIAGLIRPEPAPTFGLASCLGVLMTVGTTRLRRYRSHQFWTGLWMVACLFAVAAMAGPDPTSSTIGRGWLLGAWVVLLAMQSWALVETLGSSWPRHQRPAPAVLGLVSTIPAFGLTSTWAIGMTAPLLGGPFDDTMEDRQSDPIVLIRAIDPAEPETAEVAYYLSEGDYRRLDALGSLTSPTPLRTTPIWIEAATHEVVRADDVVTIRSTYRLLLDDPQGPPPELRVPLGSVRTLAVSRNGRPTAHRWDVGDDGAVAAVVTLDREERQSVVVEASYPWGDDGLDVTILTHPQPRVLGTSGEPTIRVGIDGDRLLVAAVGSDADATSLPTADRIVADTRRVWTPTRAGDRLAISWDLQADGPIERLTIPMPDDTVILNINVPVPYQHLIRREDGRDRIILTFPEPWDLSEQSGRIEIQLYRCRFTSTLLTNRSVVPTMIEILEASETRGILEVVTEPDAIWAIESDSDDGDEPEASEPEPGPPVGIAEGAEFGAIGGTVLARYRYEGAGPEVIVRAIETEPGPARIESRLTATWEDGRARVDGRHRIVDAPRIPSGPWSLAIPTPWEVDSVEGVSVTDWDRPRPGLLRIWTSTPSAPDNAIEVRWSGHLDPTPGTASDSSPVPLVNPWPAWDGPVAIVETGQLVCTEPDLLGLGSNTPDRFDVSQTLDDSEAPKPPLLWRPAEPTLRALVSHALLLLEDRAIWDTRIRGRSTSGPIATLDLELPSGWMVTDARQVGLEETDAQAIPDRPHDPEGEAEPVWTIPLGEPRLGWTDLRIRAERPIQPDLPLKQLQLSFVDSSITTSSIVVRNLRDGKFVIDDLVGLLKLGPSAESQDCLESGIPGGSGRQFRPIDPRWSLRVTPKSARQTIPLQGLVQSDPQTPWAFAWISGIDLPAEQLTCRLRTDWLLAIADGRVLVPSRMRDDLWRIGLPIESPSRLELYWSPSSDAEALRPRFEEIDVEPRLRLYRPARAAVRDLSASSVRWRIDARLVDLSTSVARFPGILRAADQDSQADRQRILAQLVLTLLEIRSLAHAARLTVLYPKTDGTVTGMPTPADPGPARLDLDLRLLGLRTELEDTFTNEGFSDLWRLAGPILGRPGRLLDETAAEIPIGLFERLVRDRDFARGPTLEPVGVPIRLDSSRLGDPAIAASIRRGPEVPSKTDPGRSWLIVRSAVAFGFAAAILLITSGLSSGRRSPNDLTTDPRRSSLPQPDLLIQIGLLLALAGSPWWIVVIGLVPPTAARLIPKHARLTS